MPFHPPLFAGVGAAFTATFGNVDCLFTIDGVQRTKPVRGILRQKRAIDLGEDEGQGVEGTVHTLKVNATDVPGLVSERDSVVIDGTTYEVGNVEDDGRAMLRIVLSGDI